VEININHNRTGVRPEDSVALATLTRELEKNKEGVRFVGITGYEGHTPVLPPEDKTRETKVSSIITHLQITRPKYIKLAWQC